jgi:hypothetical protein
VVLVVIGVLAFLLITDDGDGGEDAEAPEVTTTTVEDEDEEEVQGNDLEAEEAADAEAEAAEALESFFEVRGTADERAFSSEEGREELDAILDDTDDLEAEGDLDCTAQDDDTVECELDTNAGAITFLMGIDPESADGFELLGATLG